MQPTESVQSLIAMVTTVWHL